MIDRENKKSLGHWYWAMNSKQRLLCWFASVAGIFFLIGIPLFILLLYCHLGKERYIEINLIDNQMEIIELTDIDKNNTSTTLITDNTSFLSRLRHGEYSLAKTFWLFGILANVIITLFYYIFYVITMILIEKYPGIIIIFCAYVIFIYILGKSSYWHMESRKKIYRATAMGYFGASHGLHLVDYLLFEYINRIFTYRLINI